VPTFGRPTLLDRTLRSLAACHRPPEYRETVVIENGPQSGAEGVVRRAANLLPVRYMHVAPANKSAALNALLESCGDSLYVFTDDDVRVEPTLLDDYVRFANEHGPGTYFGGPALIDYEEEPPSWLKSYLPASARGWQWNQASNTVDRPVLLGFNWAAFGSDLKAVGGFDPQRGPGSPTGSTGQESDMQRRLLARGLRGIYVPTAKVWHYVPRERCTPEWTIERNYRQGVERGRITAAEQKSRGKIPPAWVVKRYLGGVAKSLAARFTNDEAKRFSSSFRRSYDRGLLTGYRSVT
jgi:GT2 family glycosyltransferase